MATKNQRRKRADTDEKVGGRHLQADFVAYDFAVLIVEECGSRNELTAELASKISEQNANGRLFHQNRARSRRRPDTYFLSPPRRSRPIAVMTRSLRSHPN